MDVVTGRGHRYAALKCSGHGHGSDGGGEGVCGWRGVVRWHQHVVELFTFGNDCLECMPQRCCCSSSSSLLLLL